MIPKKLGILRFYETLKEKGENLEIIFVSGDRSEAEFQAPGEALVQTRSFQQTPSILAVIMYMIICYLCFHTHI